MLPDPDRNRIQHMLDAAEQAVSFIEGRERNDLETDPQLRLALLRALEILGEAASRVTAGTRGAYPRIPWRRMANTRNRLIHAYFDIDLDIVWTTATQSVPRLVLMLREILGSQGIP
ncbi:MAG TPA: DUF86 domain-containing protein [Candidatus Hydrogenedentes bacterium]|nr:DUF86 domain-containing protein [Candidatus Hydrogenedentota bacterium]HQH51958.1 DUF86 domain-containing protein [Candidatus Hydrogenedentota bacterium]HQM48636.1 DUF86 domain-containing protein [Candidatus Hydrogenedentota bacterium]